MTRHRLLVAAAIAALAASGQFLAPVARASSVITVNETAQEINADGDCSLQEAIYSANLDANIAPDPASPGGIDFITTGCAAGNGADTIVLPAGAVLGISKPVDDIDNPLGPTGTPIIYSTILIEGNGARIEHTGSAPVRAFAVAAGLTNVAGTGDLTIRNVHVKGFLAKGGDGGVGAGGGLGAGGAVYVRGASLTVENSTFEGNGAQGGNGGVGGHVGGGGGGGGLGGNGGSGSGDPADEFSASGGGGGGGARGKGGSSIVTGPYGQFRGGHDGGGGGGTLTNGHSDDGTDFTFYGGVACGGDGGEYLGDTDGKDGCDGGGGGGGDRPTHGIDVTLCGVDGGHAGDGGYGGGGGGGGYANVYSTICSDVMSRGGGHGGFGGGGGAGGTESSGGPGGFGGGGGGGASSFASGGTFGGHGGADSGSLTFPVTGAGGGGAGLGGAIFSDAGTVVVRNSTFTTNYAVRGNAGPGEIPAANGQDAGGALFAVDGSLTVSNSTISGNESTGADAGLGIYRSTRGGSSASLTLTNTIIATNTPSSKTCELLDFNGFVAATGSGNLIMDNADCPGVVSSADPGLKPLAIEAPGNTPTMAIDDTSAAYDAGDDATCEAFDQRGVSRPRSLHCDIGAYEYIKPSADLAPSTTVLGAAVAGSDLALLVQVDNNGPTAAQNASIVDTLPSGTTFVSIVGSGGFTCSGTGPVTCTNALMLEGASALLTLTVHVPPGAATGSSLTNAVSVSSTTPDPVPGNNSASVTATVATRADLSITKTGPSAPTAGTDVAYAITVANLGPSNAAAVSMTDTIPAGTTFQALTSPVGWSCSKPAVGTAGPVGVSCSIASLAAGVTASFTLTVRLASGATVGADLCNTASVGTTTTDPVATNNTSQACGTIRALADLALTQSASTTGKPGKGTATFTLNVGNLGPSDASNVSLTATSSLFSGPAPAINATSGATCTVAGQTVTCSWAGIPVGSSVHVTISVPWRSSVGTVTMTGTVTAGTPDPNAVNNTATTSIGKK